MFLLQWIYLSLMMTVWMVPDVDCITRGIAAYEGQFKYIASIEVFNIFNCGGAIISQIHVLTAAHCVEPYPESALTVSVGTTNPYRGNIIHRVKKVTPHQAHKPEKTPGSTCRRCFYWIVPCLFEPADLFDLPSNDIAILTLEEPLSLTGNVATIDYKSSVKASESCRTCIFAGFGSTAQHVPAYMLLWTLFIIMTPEYCTENNAQHRDNEFCTIHSYGRSTALSGDSGSPLICADKLIGIASCSHSEEAPTIFVEVASHIAFIEKVLKDDGLED